MNENRERNMKGIKNTKVKDKRKKEKRTGRKHQISSKDHPSLGVHLF
jgi:hypothetical protein